MAHRLLSPIFHGFFPALLKVGYSPSMHPASDMPGSLDRVIIGPSKISGWNF
jgi:hypothetical protein